jgi:hypothetical protein
MLHDLSPKFPFPTILSREGVTIGWVGGLASSRRAGTRPHPPKSSVQGNRADPTCVDGIITLAKEAEAEWVQLRAWRAILAEQIAVSRFSDLEFRMAKIEEKLDERAERTHPAR